MKVRYLGSTRGACDLYRAALPFRHVESDVGFVNKEVESYINSDGVAQGTNLDCDVLIVPRPTSKAQYWAAEGAKAQGIAVVVEIDDALDKVHQQNRAYQQAFEGKEWYFKTLELADLVTCSSIALTSYHPDKSMVVHNYVPDFILDFEPDNDKDGIGWTGSVEVHPDDLQVTGDALRRIHKKYGIEFKHIGSGNLSEIVKMNYTSYGKLNYDQYLLGIDTFKVGIVPLANSEFNNAKSWLKGIEYAALGVPFVASSTAAEYVRLHDVFGIGALAYSPYEWYVELRKLYTDEVYWQEQADKCRDVVETELRMSTNAWRWDEAWAQALERSRHARPI